VVGATLSESFSSILASELKLKICISQVVFQFT